MQGQPEDKATPKSKKILPITAVSLSLFLFTRLIPCCLPSTAPDGQERDPGQTGGETTPSCGSVRNYSIRGLSCNKNKRSPPRAAGQPHPKPSSKMRMSTFAGAKMKCVPPEGISERHPVLPSTLCPLPTQQCERSFPANAERLNHPHTEA